MAVHSDEPHFNPCLSTRRTIICPFPNWASASLRTPRPCPFLNSGRFGLSGFPATTLWPRVPRKK
jgi:hypothetical protein